MSVALLKTMDTEALTRGGGDRPCVVYVNVNAKYEKPGMTFSEAYSAKVAALWVLCTLSVD